MEGNEGSIEIAISRLKKERKELKKENLVGFVTKPIQNVDKTKDILKWQVEIPGPEGTPWEGGVYYLTMDFKKGYPTKPPRCIFDPPLPHPNIYPTGGICLSILHDEQDWKPILSMKQILLGIQKLLRDQPNMLSPAQQPAFELYKSNREEYVRQVRKFAQSTKRRIKSKNDS